MEVSIDETENNIQNENFLSRNSSELIFQPLFDSDLLFNEAKKRGAEKFGLIVKCAEGKISRSKPKQIRNELALKCENLNDVECHFSRNGNLLIFTNSVDKANTFSKINLLLDRKVKVEPLYDTISVKFLVRNVDLSISLDEIYSELKYQGIMPIYLKRFARKVNENWIPMNIILVSAVGECVPEYTKLFLVRQKVSKYYDNPRQCKRCWRFGHTLGVCRGKIRCEKCSKERDAKVCTSNKVTCALCRETHLASSRDCPVFKNEVEILKYKSEHKCSLEEARKLVKFKTKSYAEAVRADLLQKNLEPKIMARKVVEISVQTDDDDYPITDKETNVQLKTEISNLSKVIQDMRNVIEEQGKKITELFTILKGKDEEINVLKQVVNSYQRTVKKEQVTEELMEKIKMEETDSEEERKENSRRKKKKKAKLTNLTDVDSHMQSSNVTDMEFESFIDGKINEESHNDSLSSSAKKNVSNRQKQITSQHGLGYVASPSSQSQFKKKTNF